MFRYLPLLIFLFLFSLNGVAGDEVPCPPEAPQTSPSTPSTPSDSGPSDSHVSTPPSETGGDSKGHLGTTFDPSQKQGGGSSVGTLGMEGGGDDKKTFGPSDFLYFMRSYIATVMQQIDRKERKMLEKKWRKESGLNEAMEGREKAWKDVLKAAEPLNKVNGNVRHYERWYNEYKRYENNPNATDYQRAEARAAKWGLESAQKDPEYQKAQAAMDAAQEKLEQAEQAVDNATNNFGQFQIDYQNQKDASHAEIPPVQ